MALGDGSDFGLHKIHAALLLFAPGKVLNAPSKYFRLENTSTTSRASGALESVVAPESSFSKFINRRYADQRPPQHRLSLRGSFDQPPNVASNGSSTAAALVAQLRRRSSPVPQSVQSQMTRVPTNKARVNDNHAQMHNPFTINFAPTVVVHPETDHGKLERNVVEAIRRHSYELVRLINRELQTQRRGCF